MSEQGIKTMVCPQCGAEIQVPAGLEQFFCLRCGKRLELEAPAEQPERDSETQTREKLAEALAGMLPALTDYPGCLRYVNRTQFYDFYAQYEQTHLAAFQLLDDAARRSGDPDALAKEAAVSLLDRGEGWIARQKGRKEIHLTDFRMTMCLLLTVMVNKNQLSIAETFNNALRDEWLRRYPKQVFQLTDYDAIVGGFKRKGLCFITTAACEFAGKDDDCPELMAFRAFRDGYLAHSPGGEALIREYYDLAPGLVTAIELLGEKQEVYPALWQSYLLPCYEAIGRGENERCRALYTRMVRSLQRRYLRS